MNLAYLSLGSNIEPERNLPRAVDLLRGAGELRAVSSVYETEPQGRADQPRFLNAAVLLATSLDRVELKSRVIAGIEQTLGRLRDPRDKNAARTIDIDVSIWAPEAHDPLFDPDVFHWAHVAVPLAEIAPELVDPASGRPLAELAAALRARMACTLRPGVRL
jgi:2-amino-4-hydroxy-6-hydroxymethyldihydropteridine diphosphokinase